MSKIVLSEEQLEVHSIAHSVLKNKWPVLLEGETGIGKNFILEHIGHELGLDVVRVNLSLNSTVEDLWGQQLLKTNDKGFTETYFSPGPALQAAELGQLLLLDEVNAALPEVLFSLHGLLEIGKTELYVPQLKRTIKIHDNFRIAATMNPSEDYVGTRDLNQAFMSRFIVLQMPPLSHKSIALILEHLFPDVTPKNVLQIVDLCVQVETYLNNEGSQYKVSVRDAMKITQLFMSINSLNKAASIVFSSVLKRYPNLVLQIPQLKDEMLFNFITISDMIDMYTNVNSIAQWMKEDTPVIGQVIEAIRKK